MALVHDMAECIVGDLTPHDDISVAEKHEHEQVRQCWANLIIIIQMLPLVQADTQKCEQ